MQGTADTCIEGTEVNDPGIWLPSVQECPPGERPKQGTEECIDIPSREPFLLSFCGVPNGNELWKSDGTDAGTEEVKKVIRFFTEEMGITSIRFPETSSIGVKPVSSQGTKRLGP